MTTPDGRAQNYLLGLLFCRTSRIKIYQSISKTTVHSCQNKCLTACPSLASFAFMVFLFRNSLQNSQNILFSFLSNLSHFYLFFHASWYFCVFWVEAGVLDTVLISLSSDYCFPPKKEYSELCTCFRFNILRLTF